MRHEFPLGVAEQSPLKQSLFSSGNNEVVETPAPQENLKLVDKEKADDVTT